MSQAAPQKANTDATNNFEGATTRRRPMSRLPHMSQVAPLEANRGATEPTPTSLESGATCDMWGRTVRQHNENGPVATELLTIREAAERCGISYESMRKRVDRGRVTIVRKHRTRLIPRTELERIELWPGSQRQLSDSLELENVRTELNAALAELATLRPQLNTERESRQRNEAAMHQHRAEAMAARARLESTTAAIEPLTGGGLISGIRALRVLRRREQQTADDNQPATV
jgi:excisionase family DNA binding protein